MLPRRTAGVPTINLRYILHPEEEEPSSKEIRIDQQGERERERKMFHKDDSLRVVNIPLVLSNYFALMITWICICAYLIVVTTILIPTGLVLSLSALSWLGCLLSPPSVDLIPLLSVQSSREFLLVVCIYFISCIDPIYSFIHAFMHAVMTVVVLCHREIKMSA